MHYSGLGIEPMNLATELHLGMKGASASVARDQAHREYNVALTAYKLAVIIPVVVFLVYRVVAHPGALNWGLLFWMVAIATVDLMPVPAWGGLHLSLTFPIRLSLAILYPPAAAASAALLGSFDPRELKREIDPVTALFNRCQIALSVLAESAAFGIAARWLIELFGIVPADPTESSWHQFLNMATTHWQVLVPATLVAALAGYVINTAIVAIGARLSSHLSLREILTRMHGAAPYQFLLEHFGLGLSSAIIVQFYENQNQKWVVAVFLAALVLARQMYFQSRALTDRLAEQNQTLAEQAARLEYLLSQEKESVAELRELNKMKSDFVAVVSHELRTPLTAIIGFVKTLLRPEFAEDAATRMEFLQAMERQGDRLLRLVENLLTVSRLENSTLSPAVGRVSFPDLCREIVEGLGASASRIEMRVPDSIPVLFTDRDLLGRVISNLLDNALKYSPDQTPCELGAEVEGTHVRFWVADRGIGIPAPELGRVFERFYQVDSSTTRAFRGTGLGLALVKDLIEQLGGTVNVESEHGVGSTFTVTLPLHQAEEATGDETPGPPFEDGSASHVA
jgi:signal transduction histidine kinase